MKKYKLNELVQATGQAQEIGEAKTSPTAVAAPTIDQPVGGAGRGERGCGRPAPAWGRSRRRHAVSDTWHVGKRR